MDIRECAFGDLELLIPGWLAGGSVGGVSYVDEGTREARRLDEGLGYVGMCAWDEDASSGLDDLGDSHRVVERNELLVKELNWQPRTEM